MFSLLLQSAAVAAGDSTQRPLQCCSAGCRAAALLQTAAARPTSQHLLEPEDLVKPRSGLTR